MSNQESTDQMIEQQILCSIQEEALNSQELKLSAHQKRRARTLLQKAMKKVADKGLPVDIVDLARKVVEGIYFKDLEVRSALLLERQNQLLTQFLQVSREKRK